MLGLFLSMWHLQGEAASWNNSPRGLQKGIFIYTPFLISYFSLASQKSQVLLSGIICSLSVGKANVPFYEDVEAETLLAIGRAQRKEEATYSIREGA